MGGAGRVHDNGAFVALGQGEAGPGESGPESNGMGRRPGSGKSGSQIDSGDLCTFLDVAALGRQV